METLLTILLMVSYIAMFIIIVSVAITLVVLACMAIRTFIEEF